MFDVIFACEHSEMLAAETGNYFGTHVGSQTFYGRTDRQFSKEEQLLPGLSDEGDKAQAIPIASPATAANRVSPLELARLPLALYKVRCTESLLRPTHESQAHGPDDPFPASLLAVPPTAGFVALSELLPAG